MKNTKTKKAGTVCRVCGRKCGRDVCRYTRVDVVTCADCERAGTMFTESPGIVFSRNPIHGDTPASLREDIENCEGAVDLELTGILNGLREYYPGAPEQALRSVALHDRHYGDRIRGNLRHLANLRRRLRRLNRRRAGRC